MRFPLSRKSSVRRTRGVALIIVLAFIVLLTGLVVAFFSRSLSERQISNGSAGQVRTDLFTQGAIATIVGDLKQEIAAGSNATYYTDSTGNPLGSVYVPFAPVTAAPALALKGQQTTVTTFPANLVKRSAYQQNFFPATSTDGASYTDYNNNNTTATVTVPPKAGATPAPANATIRLPSNRATNVSTTVASQNARTISPVRWNTALLLPKANPPPSISTDTTPYFVDPGNPNPTSTPVPAPNSVEFVPPDWILVARDGSNPGSTTTKAAFGATLNPSVNNPAPANPGYVTGRFAYTVYDEGGLLDANVAGYPTANTAYPSSSPSAFLPIPAAKTNLAYADLTIPVPKDAAVPGGNSQPLLTGAQVNSLVGWRNYASAQSSGTFPKFSPQPTPATSPGYSYFDNAVLTNLNGFMAVNNTPLYSSQSDRRFGTRQALINFFTQILPTVDTTTSPSTLQNSLQYFGTFSRGLNQPSYAPVSRGASSPANPNPRPLILASTKGGNNVGDAYPLAADQEIINPNLLSVRVQPYSPQWTRNDGTAAVVGSPLVNSRFPLQRLAWLTYLGPSAIRSTSDADMALLINTYNVSKAYLLKGDAAHIKAYFGLEWDNPNKRWLYDAHNGTNSGSGSIMKLSEVANLATAGNGREPDFFELLKASVDAGAIGKAGTNAPGAANSNSIKGAYNKTVSPLNVQFARDISLDAAIIQLGANIIDQFDVDGYSTHIVFDDGNGKREFRGIENLPYLYRVRIGGLKIRESNPLYSLSAGSPGVLPGGGSASPEIQALKTGIDPTTGKAYVAPAGYKVNPLQDAGVAVLMAVPDIWNPHDQNCSLGTPRPTSFQLIANSATPDTVNGLITGAPPFSTFTSAGLITVPSSRGSDGYGLSVSASPFMPTAPNFSRAPTGGALPLAGTPMTNEYNNPHVINPMTTTTLSFQVPDISFQVPDKTLFREPTMLSRPNLDASNLMMSIPSTNLANADLTGLKTTSGVLAYGGGGIKGVSTTSTYNPLGTPTAPPATQAFCGIWLGNYPLRWVALQSSTTFPTLPSQAAAYVFTDADIASGGTPVPALTYTLQYTDMSGKIVTYDEKYVDTNTDFDDPFGGSSGGPTSVLVQPKGGAASFVDPRTSRFASPKETNIGSTTLYRAPLNGSTNWLYEKTGVVVTERPSLDSGFGSNFRGQVPGANTDGDWGAYTATGIHYQNVGPQGTSGSVGADFFQSGLLAQNNPYPDAMYANDGLRFTGDTPGVGKRDPIFYSDPDGVVRRAMGAYVPTSSLSKDYGSLVAQPLAIATTYGTGKGQPLVQNQIVQSQSRPVILNRPFYSVAELGYVFSGVPWKNLDFSTPESGYSELLDVFCVSDNVPSDGLVAGKVDLNTRQPAVLAAVLAGAYVDEENSFTGTNKPPTPTINPLSTTDANTIAQLLVTRTSIAPTAGPNASSKTPQPLQNIADLVGRWNSKRTLDQVYSYTPGLDPYNNIDGSQSYDGFIADLPNAASGSFASSNMTTPFFRTSRMRETAVRALSNVGNTRVWNLMFDVIAQSGRYAPAATSTSNFIVEGEQRCWVHVAIDRSTGAVLDTKLEVVKE